MLPAWRLHTPDELGPAVVLAVARDALWQPGTPAGVGPPATARAVLAGTGRTLTVSLLEPVPGCPGEVIYRYRPVVRESATAVAVGTEAEATGAVPGTPGACPLDLRVRLVPYPVTLAAPLGARVLVDGHGSPVPVVTG
jgi:hypothetical protein